MSIISKIRPPKRLAIGREGSGHWKLGIPRLDLSDPYHLAIGLSWPGFVVAMIGCWLVINLFFALLYLLDPAGIVNTKPGSFGDVFYFSIETLATVGYGVMAPSSTYCHIVSAAEIVTGTAFTAIVTGLLFVRFSRPRAKITYAGDAVVTLRNGKPALMLRLANGRRAVMSSANARLFVLLAEKTAEGGYFRRIHDLHLAQPHLPLFVMPWTLLHIIDDKSPLHGYDSAALIAADAKLFLTFDAHDQTLAATVQCMQTYTADRIRFGMHYADAVTFDDKGHATADLGRIGVLEPDSSNAR